MADLTLAVTIAGKDEASGAFKAAGEGVKGFGSTLADVGKAAGGFLLASGLMSIGSSIKSAFSDGISAAEDLGKATGKMTRETGLAAAPASALLAVFARYGIDGDTASTSLGRFSKGLNGVEVAAEAGQVPGKGFAQTMKDIGVNTLDAHGKLLPMDTTLLALADKFKSMPDGAGKTADAMALFGKAGKDMIPVLNLGSAGMKELEDNAAKYGLTLSGANVTAIKAYTASHKDLDQAMAGVKLQIGVALMPIMASLGQTTAKLAQEFNQTLMPAIKSVGLWISTTLVPILKDGLSGAFAFLTGTVLPALLVAWHGLQTAFQDNIAGLQSVETFIRDHMHPILAGLATALIAVVVPAFVAWSVAAGTAALATIAAMTPVLLPIAAIGVAAGLLYQGWQTNFGGMRDTLTAIWTNTLQPTFATIQTWLSVTLPAALTTLSGFWTNTLLPAITAVWTFIDTYLLPLFTALAEVGIAAVTLAVTAVSGIFTNVLLPAITAIWSYITTYLQPIFSAIAAVLSTTVGPSVATTSGMFSGMSGVLSSLGGVITSVTGWLNDMAGKMNSIKLPDWMVRHSPSLIEQTFIGLNGELVDLNTINLPSFANSLGVVGGALVVMGGNAAMLTGSLNTAAGGAAALAAALASIQPPNYGGPPPNYYPGGYNPYTNTGGQNGGGDQSGGGNQQPKFPPDPNAGKNEYPGGYNPYTGSGAPYQQPGSGNGPADPGQGDRANPKQPPNYNQPGSDNGPADPGQGGRAGGGTRGASYRGGTSSDPESPVITNYFYIYQQPDQDPQHLAQQVITIMNNATMLAGQR